MLFEIICFHVLTENKCIHITSFAQIIYRLFYYQTKNYAETDMILCYTTYHST